MQKNTNTDWTLPPLDPETKHAQKSPAKN